MGWLYNFLNRIWSIEARRLSPLTAFCLKIVRVSLLALQEFSNDRVTLRASAMTFFSLLAIVPIVTFALAVAGVFQLDVNLAQAIYEAFPEQRVVVDQVLALAHALLESSLTRLVAISGIVVGGGSILKVLTHMDRSFSDIWGISSLRSYWRRLIQYLVVFLVLPLFLLLSSAITLFLSHELSWIEAQGSFLIYLGPLITVLIVILPFLLIASLFTFLYIFVPNTRVRFLSALVGGVTAGAAYQIVQWSYIRFQTRVIHYDVIYGGLAALPLLLIWLELSWLILLVGAEISFAYQNTELYEFADEAKSISRRMERLLAIYLLSELGRRGPITSLSLAHETMVPLSLVTHVLNELERTGLASASVKERYGALQGVQDWSIKEVWDRLDTYGRDFKLPITWDGTLVQLRDFLSQLGREMADSTANVRLRDLGEL
jgi:membrane protein